MRTGSLSEGRNTVVYAVLTGVALVAIGAVYRLDAAAPPFWLCPYRALTGLACAGCGATRALHYILHADLATAWSYNPLLFVAAPMAAVFARLPHVAGVAAADRWRLRMAWGMVALTLAFWVWRNTSAYPFLRL